MAKNSRKAVKLKENSFDLKHGLKLKRSAWKIIKNDIKKLANRQNERKERGWWMMNNNRGNNKNMVDGVLLISPYHNIINLPFNVDVLPILWTHSKGNHCPLDGQSLPTVLNQPQDLSEI